MTAYHNLMECWCRRGFGLMAGFVGALIRQVITVQLLWSGGQSSWPQIQRSGFDSRRYQIFREVVGLERGPLSLLSMIEELLERNSSGFGLEIREYGCRDSSRWSLGTLYPQKLAATLHTRGGLSVDIVRSRTQATEFSFLLHTLLSTATSLLPLLGSD
jgi:hypothetical protein